LYAANYGSILAMGFLSYLPPFIEAEGEIRSNRVRKIGTVNNRSTGAEFHISIVDIRLDTCFRRYDEEKLLVPRNWF